MVQHMGRACPCKKRRGDQTDGQRDEPHSQAHGAAKKEAGQENHGNPIAISGERKHQSVQFSTANPGTSAKSDSLLVMIATPRLDAWAASRRSKRARLNGRRAYSRAARSSKGRSGMASIDRKSTRLNSSH